MAKIEVSLSLKEIIKSILFVAGDGVSKDEIISKLELSKKEFEDVLKELESDFSGESGIHLIRYKDKIQFASNPEYAGYISDVLNPIRERALTKAALESLAIIAYKQPITRLEIEEVRGVNCDYTVQLLLEHNMIEVVGRKDCVGKPLLFGTTDEFLKRFDLRDLTDLPNYEALLERIKLIKEDIDEQTTTESLYRNYDVPTDEISHIEDDIPDFLKDEENIEIIKASDN